MSLFILICLIPAFILLISRRYWFGNSILTLFILISLPFAFYSSAFSGWGDGSTGSAVSIPSVLVPTLGFILLPYLIAVAIVDTLNKSK